VLDVTLVSQELNVGTINQNSSLLLELDILVTSERCEAPVLADNDLLAAGEFVHGSAESFDGGGTVRVSGSDREENLANVDTGDCSVGLAPSTSHTSLKSIGTGAGQHLVDADDMVGVGSNSEMETFFAGNLDEVLVGADTGSFKGFGTQLFVLVRDHVNAEGEFVDIGTLSPEIEDSDLGIWHTTVETRLGVGLVLAVAVATSRSSGHCDGCRD